MTIEYEQTYQLRTGDFDVHAQPQPASILDIFQDVAGASAECTKGMGMAEMEEHGLLWVVTRVKYEMIATPQLHEQVIARTWPLAPSRIGFQREYTMRSLDGAPLIKGSSEWIMMDAKTRAFVSVKDVYDGSDDFSQKTVFDKKVRKICPFEPAGAGRIVRPTYTDIDVNGHVNNTRYASFALDSIELSADETIHTFQIDFRHELRADDSVELFAHREGKTIDVIGVRGDGETSFAARIELV